MDNFTILVTTRKYYDLVVNEDDMIPVDDNRLSIFSSLIEELHKQSDFEEKKELEDKGLVSVSDIDFDASFDDDDEDDDPEYVKDEKDVNNESKSDVVKTISDLFENFGSDEDARCYGAFWSTWNSPLFLKRIIKEKIVKDKTEGRITVYVAPCFPTMYDTRNIYIRHKFLTILFGELLNNNTFIIAHDKDLYYDSDERNLSLEDCKEGKFVLKEDIVNLDKVFGFQHVNEKGSMFSEFVRKLDMLSYEDCEKAIRILQTDKQNRGKYEKIDKYPFNVDGTFKSNGSAQELSDIINEIKL